MRILRNGGHVRVTIQIIKWISENTGITICWGYVVLPLVLFLDTVLRYVFNKPLSWAYDISTMLGCSLFVLGWAYTHLHNGHVRIDIVYMRLSPRGKAILDAACTLLLFFPLALYFTYTSADQALIALSLNERLNQTNWYPPAFPLKLIVFIGWLMFTLQGLAIFIRDSHYALRGKEII